MIKVIFYILLSISLFASCTTTIVGFEQGETLNVSIDRIEIDCEDKDVVVEVNSVAPYTVTSDVGWSWITPSIKTGEKGKSKFELSIARNHTTNERTAIVTVGNRLYGLSHNISIAQAAFVPELEISENEISTILSGETKSVTITSNISWNASCDADWVTLSPASGKEGVIKLKIRTMANTTPTRSAIVKIINAEYNITKEVSISQMGPDPSLIVSNNELSFPANIETKSVTINSNISWSASCDADWVTLSPASSESGERTLEITTQANATTSVRTATIRLFNAEYDITKEIRVTQAEFFPELSINENNLSYSATRETKSVTISSNISWNASCDADWITLSPASGESGERTLKITTMPNMTIVPRNTTVTIRNDEYNISEKVKVTQDGAGSILEVSSNELLFPTHSETKSVIITSNISWNASCDADWITLSPASGESGESTLKITTSANTETTTRSSIIKITNIEYNVTKTISITQDSLYYIVYTSSDGKIVTPYKSNAFGANIVSNTYKDGQGIIIFDGPVTSIGEHAFRFCTSLVSITIPSSVTSIGVAALEQTSIINMTIPNSVTEIGNDTFNSCKDLISIVIPNSVKVIGSAAFCWCDNLQSVTFGNGVTSIEAQTFVGCASLTRITIPESVTKIGYEAFDSCTSLREVYCKPKNPPTGSSWMFYNNASGRIIYVPRNSVSAYKSASYWKSYASYIEGYDF